MLLTQNIKIRLICHDMSHKNTTTLNKTRHRTKWYRVWRHMTHGKCLVLLILSTHQYWNILITITHGLTEIAGVDNDGGNCVWLPTDGFRGTIYVKFCVAVNGRIECKMSQKDCGKFQPAGDGARTLQTDNRLIWDQIPERNVITFG